MSDHIETNSDYETRLIPPVDVKPCLKRQKSDANDAGAIVKAASRPTMRYVSVKSAEQQTQDMVFRTRDLFVRKRGAIGKCLAGPSGRIWHSHHKANGSVQTYDGQFRRSCTRLASAVSGVVPRVQ